MHAQGLLGRQQRPVPRQQQAPAAAPSRPQHTRHHRPRRCCAAAASRKEYEIVREAAAGNDVQLTITVPGVVCQQAFTTTVDKLRKDVVGELPGYQRDKIPLALVMQQVGGKRNFDAAVLEEVLLKACGDVLPLQADMLPASERITSDIRRLLAALDPSQPLSFTLTYTPLPPVTWANSYTGLAVAVKDNGTLESDRAAAEALITQYLKQSAQQRVVGDRGLEAGDVAVLSLRVVPQGGKDPYPGLDKDKFAFDTDVDTLGLTPNMVGMLPGETRSWEFTFPPDYSVELWRGEQAVATVKVIELFSYILPEFTDEWVASHYPQFSSAADMREALTSATSVERLRALEDDVKEALIDAVVANISSPVPERYLTMVADKEYQERLLSLVSKGVATPQSVEEQYNEEGLQQYIATERHALEDTCKWMLAAGAIAEEQGLAVDEGALEEEVDAAQRDMGPEFDAGSYRQDTREKLRMMLVMEWLQKNSKVDIQPWDGAGGAASNTAASAAGQAATAAAAAAAAGAAGGSTQ